MRPRRRLPSFAVLLLLVACKGGGGFAGKWDSTFGNVHLDLKPDHTVLINVMGIPSDGTWEETGKDQIVVHGPSQDMALKKTEKGELSDGIGGRFVKQK